MRSMVVVGTLAAALIGHHTAEAGRYCGSDETFAPGEGSTLPLGPTIAMHVEGAYFEGNLQHSAVPTKLAITLDGKPVTFTTKNVRVADGLILYITIKSKKSGALVIRPKRANDEGERPELASYTIVDNWTAPATATAVVTHGLDLRLDVYRLKGHYANVYVNAPAIAYRVRWRKNAKARWGSLLLPAGIASPSGLHSKKTDQPATANASEAHIGEAVCGFVDTVPLGDLKAGVEIELTATLPDGKTLKVTDGMPSPFVLPAAPKLRDDDFELD